jgi:molecular chaperone HscB
VANPSSSDRGASGAPGAPGASGTSGAAAPAGTGDDPFARLGLAPAYDVDPAALERAFFERSKALHPDRVAGAPAAERVAALSRARALNDAYQLIKKPVSRAEYLLARAGVTIGDNERLEPAFLMEILELREELAQARVAGDLARVEQLQRTMKARRTEALDALPALFAASDFTTIKHRLIVLRYIHRYLEECDAALDED